MPSRIRQEYTAPLQLLEGKDSDFHNEFAAHSQLFCNDFLNVLDEDRPQHIPTKEGSPVMFHSEVNSFGQ